MEKEQGDRIAERGRRLPPEEARLAPERCRGLTHFARAVQLSPTAPHAVGCARALSQR